MKISIKVEYDQYEYLMPNGQFSYFRSSMAKRLLGISTNNFREVLGHGCLRKKV